MAPPPLASASISPNSTPQASLRAATPGNALPSKSSKEAPPPVLQWVTLSSVSYFLHAVAVSPPPITVMVPAAVAATTASISALVPISNFDISNTPIGPFQIMVLEASTVALFISLDFGPQSKPMKPSGMPPSLRRDGEVHWQNDFHTKLLRFLHDVRNNFSPFFIIQGCTDRHTILHFQKCVRHATANDHLVHLVQHVHDELDFVAHLSSAQDSQNRLGRRLQNFRECIQLLGHEATRAFHVEPFAHHGTV